MRKEELIQILQNIFGTSKKSGSEYLFYCPRCSHHKPKLSINLNKGVFKCWTCPSGFSGKLRRLVKLYGNYDVLKQWDNKTNFVDLSLFDSLFAEEKKEEPLQRIDLPNEFRSLLDDRHYLASDSEFFLKKERGLTEDDIFFWKIGYCTSGEYRDRIVVPSFDREGYINYFIARSYDKTTWPPYLNPDLSKNIIFNELYIEWDEPITLVEGVFDAIKAGHNSVPLLGSSLNKKMILYKRILKLRPTVFLALDSDAERKSLNIISDFLENDIEVYYVDLKPFNDVGQMTPQEFKLRKENAKEITFAFLMETKLGWKK